MRCESNFMRHEVWSSLLAQCPRFCLQNNFFSFLPEQPHTPISLHFFFSWGVYSLQVPQSQGRSIPWVDSQLLLADPRWGAAHLNLVPSDDCLRPLTCKGGWKHASMMCICKSLLSGKDKVRGATRVKA